MSLQSIYQMPVGVDIVTVVICMSLRKFNTSLKFAMCLHFASAYFYCKICCQISKYWLLKENVWHISWTRVLCTSQIVLPDWLRYHTLFIRFFFRDCRSFASRKLYIFAAKYISSLSLMELRYLHFPANFVSFQRTKTDAWIVRSHITIFCQVHDGHFSIYRKLIIIGSHLTVGTRREHDMFGSVRQNFCNWMQAFHSLAPPLSPCTPYFSHSLTVSFPRVLCFFETPATQGSKSLTLRNIPNITFFQWKR